MKLRDDWKKHLRHAQSVRWIVIAGLAHGADTFFGKLSFLDLPIPHVVFAGAASAATALALITSFLAQKEFQESVNADHGTDKSES